MHKYHLTFLFISLACLVTSCAVNSPSSSLIDGGTSESSNSLTDASSSPSSSIEPISSSNPPASSISSSSLEYNGYYKTIDWSADADALSASLHKLLAEKCSKVFNWGEIRYIFQYTDADTSGNTKKIIGFYNRDLIGPEWDKGATWNREHVWPDSRGVGTDQAGSDPQMIRPTSVSVNNDRHNYFYGENGTAATLTYDPGVYGCPEFRGMAARIIFYTAIRWSNTGLKLSDNPNDDTSLKSMGKVSDLLKWNLEYPIDPLEIQRNNYLASINGVRNPFIDHREAATTIWGNFNDATKEVVRQYA
jgi:endonuclease I